MPTNSFPQTVIELRPSNIDRTGVGVFTLIACQSDQPLRINLIGSSKIPLPWASLDCCSTDYRRRIHKFCIGSPIGFIPPPEFDFNRLTIEWYFNHSCDGNLGFDEFGGLVAKRRIRRGEELTFDYALAEANPRFRMKCTCESACCRGIITGNDWKKADFRAKNLQFMSPALRRI